MKERTWKRARTQIEKIEKINRDFSDR
jgi:hypothetical protein